MVVELSPEDGAALVGLARAVVRARLEGIAGPLVAGATPALSGVRGAFVSIHRESRLRGCIGHIRSTRPVVEVVAECGVAAAFDDPRFPPVAREELAIIDFEVSVLSPLELARPEDIEAGRDGVVLTYSGRTAVFLPQVAREQRWGRDTLLVELCRKAGLSAMAWRAPGARLERFTAEIFRERTNP